MIIFISLLLFGCVYPHLPPSFFSPVRPHFCCSARATLNIALDTAVKSGRISSKINATSKCRSKNMNSKTESIRVAPTYTRNVNTCKSPKNTNMPPRSPHIDFIRFTSPACLDLPLEICVHPIVGMRRIKRIPLLQHLLSSPYSFLCICSIFS